MKNLVLTVLIVLISASSTLALQAETHSFYCDSGNIIKVGDTKAQTIKKDCEPLSKDVAATSYSHTRYSRNKSNTTEVVLEDWVYEGRNGFLYTVRFAGSKIIKITNEGR